MTIHILERNNAPFVQANGDLEDRLGKSVATGIVLYNSTEEERSEVVQALSDSMDLDDPSELQFRQIGN